MHEVLSAHWNDCLTDDCTTELSTAWLRDPTTDRDELRVVIENCSFYLNSRFFQVCEES